MPRWDGMGPMGRRSSGPCGGTRAQGGWRGWFVRRGALPGLRFRLRFGRRNSQTRAPGEEPDVLEATGAATQHDVAELERRLEDLFHAWRS
jgi:hypothetical protein